MDSEKLDKELWKEIQERFAKEIGLCIRTIDMKGEEIAISGELPHYCKLIKNKEIMYRGTITVEKPLKLCGEKIGTVICGPIGIDEKYDMTLLADRLNIPLNELKEARKKIEKIEEKLIKGYISILAEFIPKIAFRQQRQDKEVKRLSTLYEITRKVNSTIELGETLNYVTQTLKKELEADACGILIKEGTYNQHNNEKLRVIEKQLNKQLTQIAKVKNMKEKFGVKYDSLLFIPLKIKEKQIGSINLYYEKEKELGDNTQFLTIIANETATAINNAQNYKEIKQLAIIDKLTGTYNKRYFLELMEKRLEKEVNKDKPVSVILLDIDDFGKYNNQHGHVKGDELLQEMGKILTRKIGDKGIVGRYGGEEFIIMLETKPNEAIGITGIIKETITNHLFYGQETQPNGKLTASLGLVICMNNLSIQEAISEADDSLYKAKAKGKNAVVHKVWLGKGLRTEIN